jgi:hypothetical protein
MVIVEFIYIDYSGYIGAFTINQFIMVLPQPGFILFYRELYIFIIYSRFNISIWKGIYI